MAAKELSDRGRSVEYARWIRKCDVEIEEQEKEKKLVNIVPPRPYAITSPSSSRIVIPRLSHSGIVSGPQMPKYQYYQSYKMVTISILEKGVKKDDLRVTFGEDKLTVILKKEGVDFTVICGTLFDAIDVSQCKIRYKEEKVLITLKKKDDHN